jgi:hypothetical protein
MSEAIHLISTTAPKTPMSEQTINLPDTQHHSEHMQQVLSEVANHAREDIEKVEDPHFKALLETTAEVVLALRTTFQHFSEKTENAWKS